MAYNMKPINFKMCFLTVFAVTVLVMIIQMTQIMKRVPSLQGIRQNKRDDSARSETEYNHLVVGNPEIYNKMQTGPSPRVYVPTIVCGILTSIYDADKGSQAVNRTWAPRCDHPHFIFSGLNKRNWTLLGAVNVPGREGRGHLTEKTQAMFRWAYGMYKDRVDWYMKADDDTYVIMENLKYLLVGIDPDKPYYLGWKMMNANRNYGYHQGGAGYLLSREATRLLVEIGPNLKGCPQKGSQEDVHIGMCMEVLNVSLVEVFDAYNKIIFHPFPVFSWFTNKRATYRHVSCPNKVFNSTDEMPRRHCPLSNRAVSFHHLSVRGIYLLEYLIYDLCVNDNKVCSGSTLPGVRRREKNDIRRNG